MRVNGGNVSEGIRLAASPGSGEERSVTVKVPERDSTVELFAENRNGVSTPASFKFSWQGAQPATPKPSRRSYVLAIGISNYRDGSISLGYPAKDARDFVEALKPQRGKLYGGVEVVILTNEQATRQVVLDNLAAMKNRVGENDVGVLFIAGHGIDAKDGNYYYVPFDFDKTTESTGVSTAPFARRCPTCRGVPYSSSIRAMPATCSAAEPISHGSSTT